MKNLNQKPEVVEDRPNQKRIITRISTRIRRAITEDEMKSESVIIPEKEDSPLNEKRRQLEKLRLEIRRETRRMDENKERQEEQEKRG